MNLFNKIKSLFKRPQIVLLVENNKETVKQIISQILGSSFRAEREVLFVDSLEKKKLLTRETHGKSSHISPTGKGLEIKGAVALAYKQFILKYNDLLGTHPAHQLSFSILTANKKISEFSDQNGEKF